MAGVGDLTAKFNLDPSGFKSGLANIAADTQKFQSRLTQSFQAVSYAAQDVGAVMANGGGLGRGLAAAANNVSGIASFMGPKGMLVAGAIQLGIGVWQVVDALGAAKKNTDEFANSFNAIRDQINAATKQFEDALRFKFDVGNIGDPDAAEKMADRLGLDSKVVKVRLNEIRRQATELLKDNFAPFNENQLSIKNGASINPDQILRLQADDFRRLTTREGVDKKALEGLAQEFQKAEREAQRLDAQVRAINKRGKELAKQEKLQAAGAMGIGPIADPVNQMQEEMRAKMAMGAMVAGNVTDFAKRDPTRDASAIMRGSMEEVRAVLAAGRREVDPEQAKQTQIAKDTLAELRKATQGIQQVARQGKQQKINIVHLP